MVRTLSLTVGKARVFAPVKVDKTALGCLISWENVGKHGCEHQTGLIALRVINLHTFMISSSVNPDETEIATFVVGLLDPRTFV